LLHEEALVVLIEGIGGSRREYRSRREGGREGEREDYTRHSIAIR